VRDYSLKHWFARLPPAPAARFLALLERVHQNEWRLITRTSDRRLALPIGPDPGGRLTFGVPGQNISGAIAALNRQLSAEIFSRVRNEKAFRTCVLIEAAQALLDDDLDVAKGLLRRMVDATLGFDALAALMEAHPKSLIRMLSRTGNPSARNLIGILVRLARANSVGFTVGLAPPRTLTRPVRRA
jgi:hypothetical protein